MQSASFLGANPDEEDLSAFMHATNSPKPLGSAGLSSPGGARYPYPRASHSNSPSPSPSASPSPNVSPRPRPRALERVGGGGHGHGLAGRAHERARAVSESAPASRRAAFVRAGADGYSGGEAGTGAAGTGERRGALLTSAAAVEEELRRMNAAFEETLRAFGRPRVRGRERTAEGEGAGAGGETDAEAQREGERDTEGEGEGEEVMLGVGDGLLMLGPPRPGSRADSVASEEVLGRLELDDDRRR